MEAAQLGLEFGELKQCALVPYKDYKTGEMQCKLMVMYQGWMALLWRARLITDAQVRVVYEYDTFEVSFGSQTYLKHLPAFESSTPVKYYAFITPTYGQPMFEVMPVKQVEAHRDQYAKGLDKKDSPWNTAFDAMALKTVLRKLIKLLPISSEGEGERLVKALETDEKLWLAQTEETRVEKFKQISEAPNVPTENEKAVALRDHRELITQLESLKIEHKDLPQVTEKTDVKRIMAINDTIRFRLEGMVAEGIEADKHE